MLRMQFVAMMIATGALSVSCKKQSISSDTASLENIAVQGGLRLNQCRATAEPSVDLIMAQPARTKIVPPIGKIDEATKQAAIHAVEQSLTVVPKNVQQLFVNLGGQIVITSGSKQICAEFYRDHQSGQMISADVSDLTGCAVFFPESPKNKQILNIVVPPDAAEISNLMMRAFSGLITEFFPKIRRAGAEYSFVPEALDDVNAKRDLAFAVILDLFARRDIDKVAHIFAFGNQGFIEAADAFTQGKIKNSSEFFGAISFKEFKEETLDASQRSAREARAVNFYASEAFDSYYCNSWAPRDEALVVAVASYQRPFKDLASVLNTRFIMEKIFPTAYGQFHNYSIKWMNQMVDGLLSAAPLTLTGEVAEGEHDQPAAAEAAEGESTGSLALAGNQPESPYWAGTKAFFGSIWDNTGGAVGRGYNNYTKAVNKAVDQVYDGNVATTAVKAVTKVGSDSYQNYYDQTYKKTEARINTLQNGGMSARTAQSYGVALAVGDITGFTDAAEAIGGADTAQGRILTSQERVQRGLSGTTKIAGTMATGVGLASRVAGATSTATGGGSTVARTADALCLGPCDQVFQTTAQARARAAELGYKQTPYKAKFGETVFERTKAAEKTLPRYITRDVGNRAPGSSGVSSHSGGAFKGAEKVEDLMSKTCRSGTYNSCLQRIGD